MPQAPSVQDSGASAHAVRFHTINHCFYYHHPLLSPKSPPPTCDSDASVNFISSPPRIISLCLHQASLHPWMQPLDILLGSVHASAPRLTLLEGVAYAM